MIGGAAYWAKHRGKKTVLGGMSPVDPNWLNMMFERGVMQYIDVVDFHGFPDVFDTHWEGWQKNIERIAQVLDRRHSTAKIWITEAGFSTWQYDERKQLQEFCRLLELPLERVYWYSMHDLNPASETVDGFHLDEREYHFGLKTVEGSPKLLYRLWSGKGLPGVLQYHSLIQAPACLPANACEKPVLITGGAGFLGANLAQRLLEAGRSVIILDNLSHKGAEKNVLWLSKLYGNQVQIKVADVRNEYVVKRLVGQAGQVFHLAAQEFTEKSITSPVADFEVNVRGTLNVLEALRGMICPPPLVFTSTSRVYGSLDEIGIVPVGHRYVPMDCTTRKRGINENRPLVFQTTYCCSKGAADQYVMDYSRTYGLPAVVLRPGCVYGAHQFGSDEGGWITGMISSMMENKKVRIYGDGRQVKDLLFIDDMVDALLLAQQYIYELSGQAFNIGGGVSNTASVLEVLRRIEELQERQIKLEWEAWRTGEQRYYASDISKFNAITGWTPRTNYRDGIEQLYQSSVSSQQLSVSS